MLLTNRVEFNFCNNANDNFRVVWVLDKTVWKVLVMKQDPGGNWLPVGNMQRISCFVNRPTIERSEDIIGNVVDTIS